jgi:CRP-like cAMP-binding protein
MSLGEFFGYIASVLVFTTFYMKTMVPLRLVAIASNVAFIIYALWGGLTPILILHVLLLPLNALRLLQLRNLSRQIERAARETFSVQSLLPLMRHREIHANEALFSANDPASELFYVVEGTLFLPELQQEIGPGSFLGEFALFSESGRRTATAIARTDCTLMSLSRGAVFSALAHEPRLGIHLLKLITTRFLQNAGRDQKTPPVLALGPATAPAKPVVSRFSSPGARTAIRITVLASVALVVWLAYHPIYTVLYRDAVVTTWLNIVAAPIAGTIEDFDLKPGERVASSGEVGRIVNQSVDRSGVIRAEAEVRQASARLSELDAYDKRISAMANEWQERKSQYADGFRRNLDIKIEEFAGRVALLKERVDFADASAKRKQTLRRAGNTSQAEEETAISAHRELLSSLGDATMDLRRLRNRRDLAGKGVYLLEDGKEPEWSWRSLDELKLEMQRTERASRETAEEVGTLQASLENERKNLGAAADATFRVPAGMTIWSASASNGISVTRGQRLFTWIDCSRLMVDVPVIDTLAALVDTGSRAEILLEGEDKPRPGIVLMSRGSSSRLGREVLASITEWRKSAAQVIVELQEPGTVAGCPIGRRAFVRFPDLTLMKFLRAYLPM